MYKYSPSRNLFYPDSLLDTYKSSGSLPDDLVDISKETFHEFTATPDVGKVRVAGADGLPAWEDSPLPSKEQLVGIAEWQRQSLRAQADDEIVWRQDANDSGDATEGEITELAAWKKYRIQLMRVDPTKAPEITWPVIPSA